MNDLPQWNRFKNLYVNDPGLGFGLDISRMNFDLDFLVGMEPRIQRAFDAMEALEGGHVANPDEQRMVGHYWLRNPALAPTTELKSQITATQNSIKSFAEAVHSGQIAPITGGKFRHILLIGIGGSALGPQFVSRALGTPADPMDIFFFDNTDPDGMALVLDAIPDITRTLCIIVSKSGGTKETRNGQLVAKQALQEAGIQYARHFIAVTQEGSALDLMAQKEHWLARFPMWDWVGGRTSELSAVGLLPAALQGFDVDGLLRGAADLDQLTRQRDTLKNPAALLALMWFYAGGGKGNKEMVVLPYRDRLELFSRYLQQLVMESLGKEKDLDGKVVHQGLSVFGNKGSTDQHAFVQQLRDGRDNFFVTFIEVLEDKSQLTGAIDNKAGYTLEVEPGITSSDYLEGFYQGTRQALYESGRESMTIVLQRLNAQSVGLLIALFERAVGLYALLININAYHQPGVEAGKKAAAEILALQTRVVEHLKKKGGHYLVEDIALELEAEGQTEAIFKILRHLAANGRVHVQAGASVFEDKYGFGG